MRAKAPRYRPGPGIALEMSECDLVRAARCAATGGLELTMTCGRTRRITRRARNAALSAQPRPSLSNASTPAPSARSFAKRPAGSRPSVMSSTVPYAPAAGVRKTARQRRYRSLSVRPGGQDSTETPSAASGPGAAVTTHTLQPSCARYFVSPAQRMPPIAGSGGKW